MASTNPYSDYWTMLADKNYQGSSGYWNDLGTKYTGSRSGMGYPGDRAKNEIATSVGFLGASVVKENRLTRWLDRFLPASRAYANKIMAKVSGLEARLEALAAEVQTVSEDVALLKTQLGDADIPADAEATLERLETNMANLVTSVTPAAPQPAPVPPPAAPTA